MYPFYFKYNIFSNFTKKFFNFLYKYLEIIKQMFEKNNKNCIFIFCNSNLNTVLIFLTPKLGLTPLNLFRYTFKNKIIL